MEDIAHGTQLINCEGAVVGQINGLTVVHYADSEFGLPSRITATVHQGGGEVLDIERTVDLGGSLHAKGVLILSSYLRAKFGRDRAIHFSASIAMEQNYGGVEGDSATMAELAALISAITDLPIRQDVGITGSMNQMGEIQPIGGVNVKIEGFFAACQLKGFTGTQGVIIPQQNVRHLMLRPEIVQAVEQGLFTVHAVGHAEEALELLLGVPMGVANSKGKYPEKSVMGRVLAQLKQWHKIDKGDKPKKSKKSKKDKKVGDHKESKDGDV
jgi:predicted ATP-dependent protease